MLFFLAMFTAPNVCTSKICVQAKCLHKSMVLQEYGCTRAWLYKQKFIQANFVTRKMLKYSDKQNIWTSKIIVQAKCLYKQNVCTRNVLYSIVFVKAKCL